MAKGGIKKLFGLGAVAVGASLYLINASWLASPPSGRPTVIAQRGLHQVYGREGVDDETCTAHQIPPPSHMFIDNTLPSIAAAFAMGADVVEVDVKLTKDREFALFHDSALECRTNGRGWVGERTLAELQTLDVGYGYTADDGRSFPLRGKGVGLMPTLDEALKTHPGSRFLIQFKDGNPAVGDLMAAYLEQRDFVQWDRLTFFGAAGPLSRLKRLKPEARVWSAGATARCLVGYLALGWMGQVPKACDGGVIMIPISQSGFIWGWPDRFLERMHVHKTDHFAPDNTFEISMSSHGLDGKSAQAVWKPFFEWITASPNDYAITDEFGASGHEARHMWDTEGNPSMTLDPRVGAPKHHGWWKGDQGQVGAFLNGYDSLWLPEWLLHEDHGRRVGDALFAASRHKKIELHFNKGLAGATSDAVAATLGTATNPAVTEAFALAIIADGQKSAYPGEPRAAVDLEAARKDARAIDLAAAELRKIAPNAGSYVSESNFFNRNWQRDYWGKNYSRLQAIKTKYDPDGLFFVHHGVGSEDWSADGFTRL